jgi:hypothetical protein
LTRPPSNLFRPNWKRMRREQFCPSAVGTAALPRGSHTFLAHACRNAILDESAAASARPTRRAIRRSDVDVPPILAGGCARYAFSQRAGPTCSL